MFDMLDPVLEGDSSGLGKVCKEGIDQQRSSDDTIKDPSDNTEDFMTAGIGLNTKPQGAGTPSSMIYQ